MILCARGYHRLSFAINFAWQAYGGKLGGNIDSEGRVSETSGYEIFFDNSVPTRNSGVQPRSITSDFSSPLLPSLTVLSGLNGSGKTQFFQAIKNGFLKVDGVATDDVVLLDFTNFLSSGKKEIKHKHEPSEIWARVSSFLVKNKNEISVDLGVDFYNLKDSYLTRRDDYEFDSYNKQIKIGYYENIFYQFEDKAYFEVSSGVKEVRSILNSISRNFGFPFFLLSEADFKNAVSSISLEFDLFSNSFSSVCSEYHSKYIDNLLRRFLASEGVEVEALSRERFEEMNGPPPWVKMDEFLEQAGLPYSVLPPKPLYETRIGSGQTVRKSSLPEYVPSFVRSDTGVHVNISSFSSGEVILVGLALALFNNSSTTHVTKFPKMVLLDEVDAPLHPSRIPSLLNVVREFLVKQHGIRVILATHSPITVSLADQGNVFLMEPNPSRIEPVSKEACLRYLTRNVPTIATIFDNRRQVFVESYKDAARYTNLFDSLKHRLTGDKSLTFIEVGTRKDQNQEQNAGCDQVRRIVDDLRKGGNERVFGLIDWDRKNRSRKGVIVLCEDKRYSIENLILDPILLAGFLAHMDFGKYVGLSESLATLSQMGPADLQNIANLIQIKVLGPIDI